STVKEFLSMMKNIRLSLQIGAVFIGTVVGAGFASGQEIMQFFTRFGGIGMLTLVFSGLLFYIIAAAVIKAASWHKTYNYRDFIHCVAGGRLGFTFDILVTAFLLIGTSIMFSGSGALFEESLGLSKNWGIAFMALLTLIIILQSLNGILRINSMIVPMLFTVIVAVLASTIMRSDLGSIGARLSENYQGGIVKPVVFFLFYCCYNTFLSIGVLAALPEKTEKLSVLKSGVFLGSLGLMLLSLMLNISLTLKSPQVFEYSIPMSYITSGFGKTVINAVNICIWCEIFSTAVSNTFSIAKRLSDGEHIRYRQACFATVICCLPLAFLDFKGLIGFFYPLFGAFSMFMILRLLHTSHRLGKGMEKASSLTLLLLVLISYAFAPGRAELSVPAMADGAAYEVEMKQDLLCLMLAYPEYIENVEQAGDRVYIVMKSGKKLLYDDKKPKDIATKLAYPDLQDMLEQDYPVTPVKSLMDENSDPGRARVYSLLNEVYGASQKQIEGNLVNVKAGYGSFRFNKNNGAAEALKNVMNGLNVLSGIDQDVRSNAFPCSGTYNYRSIAGTNRLSPHSYGTAIDLAVNKRDYWRWTSRAEGQKRLESYPAEIVELFEKNNFIWGGKWGHFDIMHFEYRPEILLKARYFGNAPEAGRQWHEGVTAGDEYAESCIKKIDEALR
ncbi:MAG TPA: M15 family metallopeptidase, partial [Clostridia bacterium]|nr:M15 family metallopeptidase [Clostridia bacterium]